jgi:hypothetical protein
MEKHVSDICFLKNACTIKNNLLNINKENVKTNGSLAFLQRVNDVTLPM